MSNQLKAAREKIHRWRRDPVAFVRENFKVEPDNWQAETLRAFANPEIKRISMQACVGPGKTATLAWCALNFISCYGEPGEHPKGFACSVTSDNLSANLWPELAKWQQRSPYLTGAFTWTSERFFANDHPSTWFLGARSWPKTASADEQGRTLSGLHGKYVLAMVDESGTVPPAVARAADQALSTIDLKFGKLLQAGNPLSREGMLYVASADPRWHVVRITGDPDDPKRSPRISIEWAREAINSQPDGRNNPWVMAHVLGLFPPTSINTLFGPDEVREAMGRHLREDQYSFAARVLGVDVAREGDDRSVIFGRQGLAAFMPVTLRNVNSIVGAGTVARRWKAWDADACFVDNTGGFGSGWIDQLGVLGFNPTGVHFASTATHDGYANRRAEMWFEMSKWLKRGGALPPVPELIRELTSVTYTFSGDRVILEDKKLIKKRLGFSPDLADALALTFAAPIAPRDLARQQLELHLDMDTHRQVRADKRRAEYDPFA